MSICTIDSIIKNIHVTLYAKYNFDKEVTIKIILTNHFKRESYCIV